MERPYGPELEEIGRIDFLLNELARAVERGELHRASYDLLAPRHLQRRAELVARMAPPPSPPVTGAAPLPLYAMPAPATSARVPREPKPVPWTTVLLFLGAFLVIVASAIFSVVVWDLLPVGGKLAFLSSLTAAFFAAGWWARTRLKLRAGSVALTTVASAMLLLDGWIAIDGYNLEGPLPWAVVLFVCSAVYWFIEVRIAERFFGVIGAAAQIGWWWLLGAGLGLTTPARLAGLAVIGLLWQIASERGRDDRTLGSLALVLGWAAPLLELLVLLGVTGDAVLVHYAGLREVALTAVSVAAAGAVLWRTTLLPRAVRTYFSAAAQMPLFLAAWIAAFTTGHSWWLVGAFVLAAIVYDSLALLRAGAPFAVVGMLAELSATIELCLVLDAGDHVIVGAVAALAAVWALTPRLADSVPVAVAPGARETALVARVASPLVLGAASLMTPVAQRSLALAGIPISGADAALAAFVAAAWLAAALAAGELFAWLGCVSFSFYAAASVLAWWRPEQDPGLYAIALVVVAAVWLALSRLFDRVRDDALGQIVRWGMRVVIVPIVVAGVAAESWVSGMAEGARSEFPTMLAAGLVVVAAVVYALDARERHSLVAGAAAALFAITGAGMMAGALVAPGGSPTPAELFDALEAMAYLSAAAAGAVAAAIAAGAWIAHRRGAFEPRRVASGPAVIALTAATWATLWIVMAAHAQPGALAFGMVFSALAWSFAAVIVSPWLAMASVFAGILAVADVLRLLDPAPWVSLIAITLLGFLLAAPSLLARRPASADRRVLYDVAAIGGLAAHGWLVAAGLESWAAGVSVPSHWWEIGPQGLVIALLVVGVHVLAQAARRDFEPGYYAGFAGILLSLWVQLDVLAVEQVELYTTPLALYLAGCGLLYSRVREERDYSVLVDVATVAVGVGYPLLLALRSLPADALVHTAWVIGLSLLLIGGGIGVKSRWYLFGGSAALAAVALYRSFAALAEVWWLVLGLIGVAMLVIALTWERQRVIVSDTRARLRRSFEGWR